MYSRLLITLHGFLWPPFDYRSPNSSQSHLLLLSESFAEYMKLILALSAPIS